MLVYPTLKNLVKIDASAFEVPIGNGNDLDSAVLYISIELRHRLRHCSSGVIFIDAGRRHPQTEFVILQSGFEIRNQQVNQVIFGLVELTEVRPPGCFINARNSHRSKFVIHHVTDDGPSEVRIVPTGREIPTETEEKFESARRFGGCRIYSLAPPDQPA